MTNNIDNDNPDIHVALSTVTDDDIIIYDECGRFVPVDRTEIDYLIEQLESFRLYHDLSKIRVNPFDLSKITSGLPYA